MERLYEGERFWLDPDNHRGIKHNKALFNPHEYLRHRAQRWFEENPTDDPGYLEAPFIQHLTETLRVPYGTLTPALYKHNDDIFLQACYPHGWPLLVPDSMVRVCTTPTIAYFPITRSSYQIEVRFQPGCIKNKRRGRFVFMPHDDHMYMILRNISTLFTTGRYQQGIDEFTEWFQSNTDPRCIDFIEPGDGLYSEESIYEETPVWGVYNKRPA